MTACVRYTRRGPSRPAAGALGWAACVLLGGCINPFAPARPEPPVDAGTIIQIPTDFTQPERVLNTLALAVAAKAQGNGPDAYLGAFADSSQGDPALRIGFDPDVVAERVSAGKAQPAWTRDKELTFYRYLPTLGTASTDQFLLLFTGYPTAPSDITTDTQVTLYRQYTLTAESADNSSSVLIATGRADLTMNRVASGRWTITTWDDHRDPAYTADDVTHPCFSRLRIDSSGQ